MSLAITRAKEVFTRHIKPNLPELSTTRISDPAVQVSDELRHETKAAETSFLRSIYQIVRTENRFVTLQDLLPLIKETNYGGCETCATLVSLLIQQDGNEELRELNPQALLYIFSRNTFHYLEQIEQKAKCKKGRDLQGLTPHDLDEIYKMEVNAYLKEKQKKYRELRALMKKFLEIPIQQKELTPDDIGRTKDLFRKKPGFNEGLFDAALSNDPFTVQNLRRASHVVSAVGISDALQQEIKGKNGHLKVADLRKLDGAVIIDGWLQGEQVLEPSQAEARYNQWFNFAARKYEMVVALPESSFCKVIHPYY